MIQLIPSNLEGVTANSKKIYSISNIGEALECDTMIRLNEAMQSLPLALQHLIVE